MADVGTMGWAAAVGGGSLSLNVTYVGVHADAKADAAGYLYKFDVYMAGAHANNSVKIKVFRDDSVNYNIIGEETFSVPNAGLTSDIQFVTPIKVAVGDLMGIWAASAGYSIRTTGTAASTNYKSGDITGNSAKSTWTDPYAWTFSAKGYIEAISSGFFALL